MDEREKQAIRQNRKIVTAESAVVVGWSWLFARLVIFNHYRRFNLPLKAALTFVYAATIEPLSVTAGYIVHRANAPPKAPPATDSTNIQQ